ncbi:MAG TPA: IMP dehydrogenase, partial [Methylotenera sp.]|nr:IMP dehydrogenase [Methylotenera sp.]
MRLLQQALTFDDVLLVPAHSNVLPREVSLRTQLSRNIQLNIPLLSAAMDTVTEAPLAIALAQEGGLGFIHKNMTAMKQAAHVARVKRFESGIVNDPITIQSHMTVRDVLTLTRTHKISGIPVVDNGKIVGIVTNRDLRFETNLDQPIKNIMTQREKLVTVREGAAKDEVIRLLHQYRLERVLVVDDNDTLKGLITVKDIQKSTDHPNACKDAQG